MKFALIEPAIERNYDIISSTAMLPFYIFVKIVPIVQWIELQIPVLLMGVRIPLGTLIFKSLFEILRSD